MTLTLKPFATSVNASFRTRGSAGKQFSTNINTLPAYSFIIALLLACIRQHAHEIDDAMAVVEASERLLELRGPLRDDNHFGTVHRAVNRCLHQARNVRDCLLDVGSVRAEKPSQRHLAVVNGDLMPFADQDLNQFRNRALP